MRAIAIATLLALALYALMLWGDTIAVATGLRTSVAFLAISLTLTAGFMIGYSPTRRPIAAAVITGLIAGAAVSVSEATRSDIVSLELMAIQFVVMGFLEALLVVLGTLIGLKWFCSRAKQTGATLGR